MEIKTSCFLIFMNFDSCPSIILDIRISKMFLNYFVLTKCICVNADFSAYFLNGFESVLSE